MSEELDPQFTTCLVKKSKHYFKKELIAVGTGIIILAGLCLCLIIMAWATSTFLVNDYIVWVVVALDLIIFGGIAIICSLGSSNVILNIIRTFFKLHVTVITFVLLFAIELICLAGIPCMTIALVWMIFSEVLEFGVVGGLISGIITGIIVIPISYSALVCFKIDSWIDEKFKGVVSWL